MKPFAAAGLFAAFACLSPAQTAGSLPVNARIYVDAPGDFTTNLAATIQRKHLPFTVTSQKNAADYQLLALSGGNVIAASDWPMLWLRGYGEAAIRVIDIHTGNSVFASGLDRNSALHNWKTAAAVCASRLKMAVSRSESRHRYADPILDF